MKAFAISISLLVGALSMGPASLAESDSSAPEAPYLGQQEPGAAPDLFAPGIVSTDSLEIEGVFAPGMEAFYFVRQNPGEAPQTNIVEYRDGVWQASVFGPRLGEVTFSTDGRTMYLGNSYREKTETGWSEPESLGAAFDPFEIMRLSASAAGTYVFDERHEVGTIRYSRLVNGERQEPEAFGEQINTGTYTAHPFIAPDESYLIWDSNREGGYGDSDLYISFRQPDGTWGPAINMGEDINTPYEDAYGSVSPDGRVFTFHTVSLGESFADSFANVFWVDAEIIERLRAQ